jgi:hypothetical protein
MSSPFADALKSGPQITPREMVSHPSGLNYGPYVLKLSAENRTFFPNIEQVQREGLLVLKSFSVTPELARSLLEAYNTVNRNPIASAWRKYARDMMARIWFPTHQALAFGITDEGEWVLLDGQNRLLGVDESGETVEFLVFFGFHQAFQVLNTVDSGKNRTYANSLTILNKAGLTDIKNPSDASSIINAFFTGSASSEARPDKFFFQGLAISVEEPLNFLMARVFPGRKPKASISAALLRAHYAHTSQFDEKYTLGGYRDRLVRFGEILSGDEVSAPAPSLPVTDSYAYALRVWLEVVFPEKKQQEDVLQKLGRVMGGSARRLLYKVSEFALSQFLHGRRYTGFSAWTNGKGSKPSFKTLSNSLPEEDIFPLPTGITRRAKTEAGKLASND